MSVQIYRVYREIRPAVKQQPNRIQLCLQMTPVPTLICQLPLSCRCTNLCASLHTVQLQYSSGWLQKDLIMLMREKETVNSPFWLRDLMSTAYCLQLPMTFQCHVVLTWVASPADCPADKEQTPLEVPACSQPGKSAPDSFLSIQSKQEAYRFDPLSIQGQLLFAESISYHLVKELSEEAQFVSLEKYFALQHLFIT